MQGSGRASPDLFLEPVWSFFKKKKKKTSSNLTFDSIYLNHSCKKTSSSYSPRIWPSSCELTPFSSHQGKMKNTKQRKQFHLLPVRSRPARGLASSVVCPLRW